MKTSWGSTKTWAKVAGLSVVAAGAVLLGAGLFRTLRGAPNETVPKFKFDPDWPKPLPNKWKIGGITGLAVDKDDNVWALDRPNDLTDIELEAGSLLPSRIAASGLRR